MQVDLVRPGARVSAGALLRHGLSGRLDLAGLVTPVSADDLIRALDAHGVSCTLLPALAELPNVPSAAREFAEARRFAMACSLLPMRADLAVLADLLEGVGTPWAVIKGPVAATTLYGELRLREWTDLDVVVDRRAFADVLEALERAGARLLDRNWAMVAERLQAELTFQLPNGTALDLHWHVVNSQRRRRAFAVDVDALLARRRTVVVAGRAVPALSAHDQLLHLALHGCLSGGHRLQWLKDVQLAAGATTDWVELVSLARQSAIQLPVALMLERARHVLSADVPAEALDALAPRGGWRAVGRAATQAAPPQESHRGSASGRIAFAHVRRDTARTAAAVLHGLPGWISARRDEPRPLDNPLREHGGTTADRASYLRRVVDEG